MSSVVETRTALASDPPTKPKVTFKEEEPADLNIPDNYVSWTLRNQKALPPVTWGNLIQNVQWLTFTILVGTPAIAIWGITHVHLRWETFLWSALYYLFTGLGESLFVCLHLSVLRDASYARARADGQSSSR